jgi:SAM-dependent methyltransferase
MVPEEIDSCRDGIQERPGYKTYTTDLRKDTNPDFVMDTQYLNFPDETWDMVNSCHHLEHLPRWEQEKVWQEMFRILKPGGDIEHVVPSLEWASHKVAGGENDASVFNVFYGAQEASHQIEPDSRNMNTHFFGYTKVIAIGLAEASGFVDVEVKDWRDDPQLGLNMIIRARKPKANEVNGEKKEKTASKKRASTTKTKAVKKSTPKKRKTARKLRRGAKT